ncbi:AfsR/SARP family transcriptional regulator [Stackebrandtia nassauensis]|uniref:Transcriptional regulator, SARP family n=1 Tax=Stackebrandtia nassauensis (strain DSM 44728 / CIP 108903 / NRRL B-16338 / NBRC 102104 / LLR-40K-21) TaxID=446470 RepID=D3Q6R6_STANL|nr:BTAD domain-containing putative transcriptional regulator [Stackebrandtia nassauensis]ADD40315.1 transcriptional regulator, SARP family [Stackebrandtia nassauensis DSM 44728]
MLVRLLGSVEIASATGWARAGPAKRSCVLAALAVTPRVPVTLATLTERVWGTGAPSSAHSTLYGHIAHLRTLLRDCPGEVTLRRSGIDGYVLDVEPELIDVHALRSLVHAARDQLLVGDGERAVERWRRAGELVRGEALAGVKGDWAAEVRSGLRREHAALLAERFTVELELNRHNEIIDELADQVARHPLSESLVECLMTALYRSGRPAEALSCFAEARFRLAERLGADPGTRLRELNRRILKQDPELARPTPASAPVARGGHPFAQLPAAPRLFTGRAAELSELDNALDAPDGARLWTVSGPGGIGKSWLALHWSHRRRDAFADGQLYVNLHGFDPGTAPTPPETALRGLLETLGVAPAAIPTSLDAMSGLYRSLLVGKRVLILVDDARDSRQVIPLLPGDDAAFTVVTGRPGLATLATSHGAAGLRLDTLSHNESREAFSRHLGHDRIAAEPEATAELVGSCAGLPLALGILAARAAAHPGLPLAALAESVRDDSARLDALDTGELSASLRAVLEGSLAAVRPEAARLFALLGLAPGIDAERHAVASLAAASLGHSDALLRELDSANLVEQRVPGRYRMHDLTRLYAAERAEVDLDESDRDAALRRVVDHYLYTAAAGRELMQRGLIPRDLGQPAPGCVTRPLTDLEAAKRWFAAEHVNIVAAQRKAAELGWDASVWRLAWALTTFQILRRRSDEGVPVWRRAVAAAENLDDLFGQVVAHHTLSQMLIYAGDYDDAATHAARALDRAEASGDVHQLVGAHDAMSKAYVRQGDYRLALRHSTRSLDLARRTGNQILEAQAHNSVGWHLAHLGEYAAARGHCEQALDKARAIPDDYLAALILDSLGFVASRDDRPADASVHYRQALELVRRFGATEQEPTTMVALAEAEEALGRRDEAERLRREAADLYEAQGYAEEAALLRKPASG